MLLREEDISNIIENDTIYYTFILIYVVLFLFIYYSSRY